MCDKHYRTYLVILKEKVKGFLKKQGKVLWWQQYNFLSKEKNSPLCHNDLEIQQVQKEHNLIFKSIINVKINKVRYVVHLLKQIPNFHIKYHCFLKVTKF
jgi:hypothetical protein